MMSTPKRRGLMWTLVIVAIAIAATAALRPRPLDVDVAVVTRAPLRSTVEAEARTRVRSRFVITAPVTGRLQRTSLRSGDVVRAGAVVARISALPLDAANTEAARSRVAAAQAAQRDADARVRQAEQASSLAARMLARQRALEEVGGLSRQQREEAELTALIRSEELAAAKSRVRAASAELGAARAAIPQPPDHGSETGVVVRAPSDGRVLLVLEESERVVTAGTTLLELGRDSDLEIVADVLSEDAVRIPPDAPVDLVGWGGDVLLHGTVRRIEPAARTRVSALGVEEQRVNVIITPTKAPRALGDGFRLDAHITIWEGRDVLVALASAVYTVGDESRVFVVENGRARERTIRVGHRSDAGVEILEGLTAGEVVVLFPSDRVRSGVRLRYIEPTTAVSARGP